MLSRYIPIGANTNYADFTKYLLLKFVEFVKLAFKTGRGCHSIYCTYCLPFILLLCCSLTVAARPADIPESAVLPNQSVFMFDVGYASIHDSYLTPITYDGIDVGLSFEATRATRFAPERWIWQLNVGAEYKIGKLTLGLNVHNLLNTHYNRSGMNTALVPQQGRWWMASASYQF
jgi:hypothetical protein